MYPIYQRLHKKNDFTLNNKKKCFLRNVTLNTGVMVAENSSLPSQV